MPGVNEILRMVVARELPDPQAFPADTFKEPDVNTELKFRVTDVVPCPLTIVAFVGATHVYVVAKFTGAMV